jgi:uncharacterized protein YqeY
MGLVDTIKEQLLQARKDRDEIAKNVLSCVLGEIQSQQARAGQRDEITDAQAAKIVQKVIEANNVTIAAKRSMAETPEMFELTSQKLRLENVVLARLLPHNCTREEIAAMLGHVIDKLRSASGDGPAIGIAMKALAQFPGLKDGKLVAEVVKELRAA